MSQWIELHDNLMDHPKLFKLMRILKLSRYAAGGILCFLWLWVSRFAAEDGDIGKFEPDQIAQGIGWKKDPELLIQALIEAGLLDKTEHSLKIHDWDKFGIRILKESRERQKDYRERKTKSHDHIQKTGSAALAAARAVSKQ